MIDFLSQPQMVCYANDNDAFIPELWALEGLAVLEENMVAARLVNRDFENDVRSFGDVVNTRRPGTFKVRRKTDSDSIVLQDAVATNVQVPLNQHIYTSFTIKDGERSKSFKELSSIYLVPACQVLARAVDRAVIGQAAHKCLSTPTKRSGRLLNLSSSTATDYVLEARRILNDNKAYQEGRSMLLSSASETAMLQNTLFLKANERGDGGNALQNAMLGRILGFNTYMDQNANSIAAGSCDLAAAGTITNALAAGGSGAQACTITGHEVQVGEFCIVAGNDQPTYATAATVGAGDTTSITLNEANKFATGALAVVQPYEHCDVNGDYAIGYTKGIVLDGWATAPQIGQLMAFNTGANRRTYTVIESELTAGGEQTVYLDRPLEVALANNDLAFPGPAGSINLAFHKDAIALVTRPLALPDPQTGAKGSVQMYNDLAMRVVMQYDIHAQGLVVTLDMLAGVAMLDANLAVALLG